MRVRENERVSENRTTEMEKEDGRVVLGGRMVGWLERAVTAPLEAVMRSVVDGLLIGLLAPPLSPVSGARRAGGISPDFSQE